LKNNCVIARQAYHWENEEKKLMNLYASIA
jgi:hypothetical protein